MRWWMSDRPSVSAWRVVSPSCFPLCCEAAPLQRALPGIARAVAEGRQRLGRDPAARSRKRQRRRRKLGGSRLRGRGGAHQRSNQGDAQLRRKKVGSTGPMI